MTRGDKQFHKRLGEHIRRRRLKCRLSSKELARRSNLSKSMISQLEHGANSASLKSLMEIARVLKIDMNQIVYAKIPKTCIHCNGRGYL